MHSPGNAARFLSYSHAARSLPLSFLFSSSLKRLRTIFHLFSQPSITFTCCNFRGDGKTSILNDILKTKFAV